LQRKAYKTFEEFCERVKKVGLNIAWNQQYRQTGRTTTEIAKAVHEICATGNTHCVVLARNIEIAQGIQARLYATLAALGVPGVIVVALGVGPRSSGQADSKTVVLTDHTYTEEMARDRCTQTLNEIKFWVVPGAYTSFTNI